MTSETARRPTTQTQRLGIDYTITSVSFEGPQGEGETVEVSWPGQPQFRLGLWEYSRIYRYPGLYEAIILDHLASDTHELVCNSALASMKDIPLRVLDVGSGVGLIGEWLKHRREIEHLIGFDALSEAKTATLRDRSGVYNDFIVGSVFELVEQLVSQSLSFNCMIAASCVGCGDITPKEFQKLCQLVEPGGVIAFNVREIPENDQPEILRIFEEVAEVQLNQVHFHRYRVDGATIRFRTVVGQRN